MTIDARLVQHGLFGLVVASAIYTGCAVAGHFYTVIPRYRAETAWFVLGGLIALFALLTSKPLDRPRPIEGFTRGQLILVLVVFAGLSFALYAPACSLGFLSDDFVLLSKARRHEFWGGWQFFRPLPLAIWAMVQGVAASPAPALHALNIFLHAVNATLVAVLACRLRIRRAAAVAAGFLFMAFPASVEPVAWASGIQDVLLATFCLGFVLACTANGSRTRRLVVGLACLVLALCTKEAAVVAPLLAFVFLHRWQDGGWDSRIAVYGAVLSAGYAAVRLLGTSAGAFAVWPSRYLLKELLSRPFATLGLPFTGSELQRLPALAAVLAWLFIAALLVAVWRWRDDRASAGVAARCVAWVVLSVAPVYSMLFVTADLQGSRYMYLAACGWSILLATLWVGGAPQRGWVPPVGLVTIVLLAVVWLAGVGSHLEDWREASRLRDRVMASAIERLHHTNCDVVHFTNLPDSVRGAYVFRNGFSEAMSETPYASKASMASGPPSCTVHWDGVSLR